MEVKWLFNVDLYTPTPRSDCERFEEYYTNIPVEIILIFENKRNKLRIQSRLNDLTIFIEIDTEVFQISYKAKSLLIRLNISHDVSPDKIRSNRQRKKISCDDKMLNCLLAKSWPCGRNKQKPQRSDKSHLKSHLTQISRNTKVRAKKA